jgi:hypothetical protein
MEANTQAANDLQQKLSQAVNSGTGGMGGMGGGGGGGGLGSIFGMLGGGGLGGFFKNGGVVGKSGGSTKGIGGANWAGARSMKVGGIVGDPEAEPIIAHKGELVTPQHEVDRMRRLGKDAALLDNAAVRKSSKANAIQEGSGHMSSEGTTKTRASAMRPQVTINVQTKDADSFRQSEGQIYAKAGAAAYRDAVRNN